MFCLPRQSAMFDLPSQQKSRPDFRRSVSVPVREGLYGHVRDLHTALNDLHRSMSLAGGEAVSYRHLARMMKGAVIPHHPSDCANFLSWLPCSFSFAFGVDSSAHVLSDFGGPLWDCRGTVTSCSFCWFEASFLPICPVGFPVRLFVLTQVRWAVYRSPRFSSRGWLEMAQFSSPPLFSGRDWSQREIPSVTGGVNRRQTERGGSQSGITRVDQSRCWSGSRVASKLNYIFL